MERTTPPSAVRGVLAPLVAAFRRTPRARLLRSLAMVAGAGFIALPACAREATPEALEPCVELPYKMYEPNRWVVKGAEPQRWAGYNDKPVDTCLGPNRYRIPANHFYDQMGPDFQGGVVLLMQWPDLQAPPPGKRSEAERAHTLIRSSLEYVNRVSIGPLLEKFIDYPSDYRYEKLDQRDRQPPRFGLIPYYVNEQKFRAHKKERERIDGYESIDYRLENQEDWYLDRDAEGRLTTLIKCGSHLKPDGYAIREDHVEWVGPWGTSCTHRFVIPEHMLSISIDYSRVLLKDWKRFEAELRRRLKQYRVR